MARELRIGGIRLTSDGSDESVLPPPDLAAALRDASELSNALGDKVRLVEFNTGEVETDHPIAGWDTSTGSAKPILVGPWPAHERWALFYNSVNSDLAGTSAGRYVASDGFTAPDVMSMRRHFKTTHADSQPANPLVSAPGGTRVAAQGEVIPAPPDLARAIREQRKIERSTPATRAERVADFLTKTQPPPPED